VCGQMKDDTVAFFYLVSLGLFFLYAAIWGLGHGRDVGMFSMFTAMGGVLSLTAGRKVCERNLLFGSHGQGS
jgi:hypothetical protein